MSAIDAAWCHDSREVIEKKLSNELRELSNSWVENFDFNLFVIGNKKEFNLLDNFQRSKTAFRTIENQGLQKCQSSSDNSTRMIP